MLGLPYHTQDNATHTAGRISYLIFGLGNGESAAVTERCTRLIGEALDDETFDACAAPPPAPPPARLMFAENRL